MDSSRLGSSFSGESLSLPYSISSRSKQLRMIGECRLCSCCMSITSISKIPEWMSSSTSCGWMRSPARYSFLAAPASLLNTARANTMPSSFSLSSRLSESLILRVL